MKTNDVSIWHIDVSVMSRVGSMNFPLYFLLMVCSSSGLGYQTFILAGMGSNPIQTTHQIGAEVRKYTVDIVWIKR